MSTPRAPVSRIKWYSRSRSRRQIAPPLPAVALDHTLDAADKEAYVRGRAELGLEPAPLRLAEHRLGGIGIGQIALLAGRAALIGRQPGRPKPAQVQPDELHAAGADREHLRVIQPVTRAARVIGGELPEAQELVFRGVLVGNSAPPSFTP